MFFIILNVFFFLKKTILTSSCQSIVMCLIEKTFETIIVIELIIASIEIVEKLQIVATTFETIETSIHHLFETRKCCVYCDINWKIIDCMNWSIETNLNFLMNFLIILMHNRLNLTHATNEYVNQFIQFKSILLFFNMFLINIDLSYISIISFIMFFKNIIFVFLFCFIWILRFVLSSYLNDIFV